MNVKPGIRDFAWMACGAAVFLAVMLVVLHYQNQADPAKQMASKAQRLEMVSQMQAGLAQASEAEKSAMLAGKDEDAEKFGRQVRAATTQVGQEQAELSKMLAESGNQHEKELLEQFTQAFAQLRQIDNDLLTLSTRNTNIKATALLSGPASEAIEAMDTALGRVGADDTKAMRLIANARIAGWRLLTLIPPHIAEDSDQKMDQMEVQMDKQERQARKALDELAAMPGSAGNADLVAAAASYARFGKIKVQILELSRENTNVRALSISLNQKRKVSLVCQASLAELRQAIQAEPVVGAGYGNVKPR